MKARVTVLAAILAILAFFQESVLAQTIPVLTIRQIQEVPADTLNSSSPTAQFSRYVGDTVTVRGVVVAAPRISPGGSTLFALGNAFTMYIVDENGGAWSGLNVRATDSVASANTMITAVDTGFVVQVTGVVTQYFTTTQFEIGKITGWNAQVPVEITDTKPLRPEPTPITLADLVTGDPKTGIPAAQQWEGAYVVIRNVFVGTVSKGSNGRYTWTVTDNNGRSIGVYDQSVYFRSGSGTGALDPNWAPPPTGTALTHIRGVITSSGQGIVIAPFYPGDIKTGSTPPVIKNVTRSTLFPKSTESVVIDATIEDTNPDGDIAEAKLVYGSGTTAIGTLDVTLNKTAKTGTVTIPAQPDGSVIWYYLTAKDNSNETVLYPSDTTKSKPFYIVRNGALRIRDVQYTPFADGVPGCQGATVTLSGTVTADTTLGLTYIQDDTQPWSGILVRGDASVRNLVVGENVTVTGKVQEGYSSSTNSNTCLIDAKVDSKNGTAPVPQPILLTTGVFKNNTVTDGTPSAEQWEGMLVTFRNLTVTATNADAPSFFGETLVNDGSGDMRFDDFGSWKRVYTNDTAKKNLIMLIPGTRIANLTGIMFFNFGNYKLEPRTPADLDQVTDLARVPGGVDSFSLDATWPNPVRSGAMTSVRFSVRDAQPVQLVLCDALGRAIRTLYSGSQTPGTYDLRVSTEGLVPGVYFLRLTGRAGISTSTFVLAR